MDIINPATGVVISTIKSDTKKTLNSKLETKVTLEHFRPNIVVSGLLAYEEDNWSSVKIGSCEFDVILKTPRCNMTTIDPITTKVDGRQEPLRTLSRYRKTGNKINFGIYLIPKNAGPISITDEITYRRNQVIANKNNP